MPLTDYQLYVNVAHKGMAAYVLRTLEFRLEGINILPYGRVGEIDNRTALATEIRERMKKNGMSQVPDGTPFFLGAKIISPYEHRCETSELVDQIMRAMRGLVFADIKMCDGISVIRCQEGDVSDCQINIAWKEQPPPKLQEQHPLFGAN